MTDAETIIARYPGRCGYCGHGITEGDPITESALDGWVHADHQPKRPTPGPCPICWTTPAANGACDCD